MLSVMLGTESILLGADRLDPPAPRPCGQPPPCVVVLVLILLMFVMVVITYNYMIL